MIAATLLIAIGFGLVITCHGWWRNPSDYLTQAVTFARTAASSLFAKGPQT